MEPSIKGSLLAVALGQLRALVESGVVTRAEAEAALGDRLPPAQWDRVAPSAWYPVTLYDRVLTLMMQRAGGGQIEYLVQLGREGALMLARQGIYKQLGRQAPADPDERFVRMLLTLAKALYSFTQWDLQELSPELGRFVIRISGAADYPDSLRWRNCGFLEVITSHAVGRKCTIVSDREPWDCIRFYVQWRAPR